MSGIRDYEIIDQILDKFKDEAKENERTNMRRREAENTISKHKEEVTHLNNVINNYRGAKEKLDRIENGIAIVFNQAREEGKDYDECELCGEKVQVFVEY